MLFTSWPLTPFTPLPVVIATLIDLNRISHFVVSISGQSSWVTQGFKFETTSALKDIWG